MTISQLIENSGLKLSKNEKSKIGALVLLKSKELNIPHDKVEEVIYVNDYPDRFVSEMETIVINFLNNR